MGWFEDVGQPTSSAPTAGTAAGPGTPTGGGLPAFRPGMSDDEVRSLANQYIAAGGAQNIDNGQYWVNAYKQFGQNDPAYFQSRLQQGIAGQAGAPQAGSGGSPSDVMAQDPGFQFRFEEGAKALQRSAAARGTLLTGGTQKALERYGQDYASNEFGNIFNRNLQLAQLGERAAAGQADTTTSLGNAQGASSIASGNAWSGATSNLGNLASFYAMNRRPPTTTGYQDPYANIPGGLSSISPIA